jgi:hypothetical protein
MYLFNYERGRGTERRRRKDRERERVEGNSIFPLDHVLHEWTSA